MIELRIDPEFRDKIPPLTEEEYKQLKENILEDGEVYEPISVWNGTIVDGHNRWKIICENKQTLDGKYKIRQLDFENKHMAFEWMYKKQLGRRNLTDEQRTMLIGKMYESRKKSHGAFNRFLIDQSPSHQNDDLQDDRKEGKTAKEVAAELGIGKATVERAERFSQGIDTLSSINKEAAEKVLKGKTGINKKTVMQIPKMEPEQQKEIADAICKGDIKEHQKKSTNPNGWNKELREDRKQTQKAIDELLDTKREINLTIERLLSDIRLNGAAYIDLLSNSILRYKGVINSENRKDVILEIDNIIKGIKGMEEKL